MGLQLRVANPSQVFLEPLAGILKVGLSRTFGDAIQLDSEDEPYAPEVAWSGWRKLQELAVQTVGEERAEHLLSVEAWTGCYVPVEAETLQMNARKHETVLDVGSIPHLIEELESLGRALELPVTDNGLRELMDKVLDEQEEDELAALDLETFAVLLPAARLAQRRRQVLWIVK